MKKIFTKVLLGALLALGVLLLDGTGTAETECKREGRAWEYTLREYQGCVAVFSGPSEFPRQVTDIEVRLLPVWDRELLSGGIGAENEREVSMLLEDLGS